MKVLRAFMRIFKWLFTHDEPPYVYLIFAALWGTAAYGMYITSFRPGISTALIIVLVVYHCILAVLSAVERYKEAHHKKNR